MDLMELVDGSAPMEQPNVDQVTTFGRVFKIIQTLYEGKEFSTADIAREYEELHNEPIGLSTISTYLSRMCERGHLRRQKFGNSWVYRQVYLAERTAGQLPLK